MVYCAVDIQHETYVAVMEYINIVICYVLFSGLIKVFVFCYWLIVYINM